MDCIDERINAYIGHAPEVDEDIATKEARRAYRAGAMEQLHIDEEEVKVLVERFVGELRAERVLLTDKAVEILVNAGFFGSMNSDGAKLFRERMGVIVGSGGVVEFTCDLEDIGRKEKE